MPSEATRDGSAGRGRIVRLVGWVAAANAVAVAFAVTPSSAHATEGARALLAWCGIG